MTTVDLKPSDEFQFATGKGEVLLIACGALAREIVDLIECNRWAAFDVQCLPAKWHNTPQFIVPAVREKIRSQRDKYKSIFVLYGDCGTGGLLDAMLLEEGVERIEGAHCYEFYLGADTFEAMTEDDPATFFLTDYLVRHFDRLVIKGLGLDRFPQLLETYFGNYTRVVYLAQFEDAALKARAQNAAARLGLAFEMRLTGLAGMEQFLLRAPARAEAHG